MLADPSHYFVIRVVWKFSSTLSTRGRRIMCWSNQDTAWLNHVPEYLSTRCGEGHSVSYCFLVTYILYVIIETRF